MGWENVAIATRYWEKPLDWEYVVCRYPNPNGLTFKSSGITCK